MTFIEPRWHARQGVIQRQETCPSGCFRKFTKPLGETHWTSTEHTVAHAQECHLLRFWLASERWGSCRGWQGLRERGRGCIKWEWHLGTELSVVSESSPSLYLPFLTQSHVGKNAPTSCQFTFPIDWHIPSIRQYELQRNPIKTLILQGPWGSRRQSVGQAPPN